MEAKRSSETSVNFQKITRPYIPESVTLHKYRCENLRACTVVLNPIVQTESNLRLVDVLLVMEMKKWISQ
jgi:hypothetical protein